MLYFLAAWILLFLVCFPVGSACLHMCSAAQWGKEGDRIIIALWLGIILLSTSYLAAAMFIPLSFGVSLSMAFSFMGLSLCLRTVRTEVKRLAKTLSLPLLGYGGALSIAIATFMTQEITWVDTKLYHLGAIRWLSDYGMIPGIALINHRFGWISAWFALITLLNPPFVQYRTTAVLNGFVLLLIFAQFICVVRRILRRQDHISDWFIFFAEAILLPLLLIKVIPVIGKKSIFAETLISPSPDLVANLLVILTAWLILLIYENRSSTNKHTMIIARDQKILPILFAAGATSFKLVAFPLLIVTNVFYLIYKKFRPSALLACIGINTLMLSPLLGAGITASGCPFSPSKFLCLDLPWSANLPYSLDWGLWWRSDKLIGLPSPQENYWLWLLPRWLQANPLNTITLFLNILAIIFLIKGIKSGKISIKIEYLEVLAISLVGILVIITQAPTLRYGLGYFLVIPCLIFALSLSLIRKKIPQHHKKVNSFEIACLSGEKNINPQYFNIFLWAITIVMVIHLLLQSRLFLPPKLVEVKATQSQINDLRYVYATDPKLCWATQQPCALGVLDNIQLRNPSMGIKGGFVIAK